MDNEEKKAFTGWLSLASDKELQSALVKIQSLDVRLTESEARLDARFLMRGILKEMDARREVAATRKSSK